MWKTPPPGVWHFLTVPPDLADEIDERTTGLQGGFGSVKVEVTIGATTWSTSIFPSKEAASFILPVKQAVRRAEDCEAGTDVVVSLVLVGFE
ncbi:MAG: DUF1905 domain-containing protein [Salana multivorans]|nr:DUF1905 domain-containing protein [Salana multivorans]